MSKKVDTQETKIDNVTNEVAETKQSVQQIDDKVTQQESDLNNISNQVQEQKADLKELRAEFAEAMIDIERIDRKVCQTQINVIICGSLFSNTNEFDSRMPQNLTPLR